jgi:hypothetical protein
MGGGASSAEGHKPRHLLARPQGEARVARRALAPMRHDVDDVAGVDAARVVDDDDLHVAIGSSHARFSPLRSALKVPAVESSRALMPIPLRRIRLPIAGTSRTIAIGGYSSLLHGLLHHQLADRGHARHMLAIKGLWEFSRVGTEVSQPRQVEAGPAARYRDLYAISPATSRASAYRGPA